jgi:serine/threonine protein kinase
MTPKQTQNCRDCRGCPDPITVRGARGRGRSVARADRPEDRTLVALAASSSNISINWQQGRFAGAGAYGKVYTAHNMDQNTVMAVKEIRFSDVSDLPSVYKAIRDESTVMQMLNHV